MPSKGYIWYIYPDDGYRWMIQLHGAINHGLNFFASGGYYFYMPSPTCRVLLQLVKPHDDLEFVELHSDFDVVLTRFCYLNGLGHDPLFSMPWIPNDPLLEPIYPKPTYSGEVAPDAQIYTPLATNSIIMSELLPCAPGSGYQPDSEKHNFMIKPDKSTFVHWSSTLPHGTDGLGIYGGMTVLMNVPNLKQTKEEIVEFVKNFVHGLGPGVRRVACSLCCGEKSKKLWDVKPTNLIRHLFVHFKIKGTLDRADAHLVAVDKARPQTSAAVDVVKSSQPSIN
ncbi:hypothetical protein OPQ81_010808 [Rhizoctonia solani]|nr:hypothetical protein OPQ81_010808 [Rhizoctonia solani]